MTKKEPVYGEPSDVRAVEGDVELDGPDDVDVAMTPDAAEETSERLLREAFKARGQKRLDRLPHRLIEQIPNSAGVPSRNTSKRWRRGRVCG